MKHGGSANDTMLDAHSYFCHLDLQLEKKKEKRECSVMPFIFQENNLLPSSVDFFMSLMKIYTGIYQTNITTTMLEIFQSY